VKQLLLFSPFLSPILASPGKKLQNRCFPEKDTVVTQKKENSLNFNFEAYLLR
jgi:hypothetical protein